MFMQTATHQALVEVSPSQVEIGLLANKAATKAVFAIYQARRPENTRRAQKAALGLFSAYMRACGIATPDLYAEAWAWQGITWGLVQGFQDWMLEQGYSVKTVNDRVSAVKVYMSLANQAGIIPDGEILRLRSVRGFTRKEGIDTDKTRAAQGLDTRKGAKKAAAALLTDDQARKLKAGQTDTPQGRRDALLMVLLLDHGLRVSEAAGLCVENIDRDAKQMTFYREKTGRVSRHALRGRAWQLMAFYLEKDQKEASGPLFLASNKSGALLAGTGLTVRAIHERVKQLGRAVGVDNLSPHDCRHYGATKAGHDPNVSLAALMAWGDWQSPTSAARYIERGQTDNDGVSLGLE
jgi:integrase